MNAAPAAEKGPLRRAFGHFAWLMGGRTAAALLSFASLVLSARILGPEGLGQVVLIHTYALLVRGLLNFKPFEAIVRYGISALEDGDTDSLRGLLRGAAALDILSALGCVGLVVAAAPLAGRLLGWDSDSLSLVNIYAGVLLLSATGTAKGILRLFGRFDTLGRALVVAPAVRLLAILVAYQLSAGVSGFVWAWALGLAAEYLFLNLRGWRELKRRLPGTVLGVPSLKELEVRHPGYWRFLWIVYWQSSLDLLPKHGATLLVGALLGPASAGMFRAAREISNVLSKPAVLLRQAVFPDLARLWHAGGEGFDRFYFRTALLVGIPAGILVLVSLVFGESVLAGTLGEEYRQAAGLLTVLLLAAALELAGAALRPAAYAMDKAGAILRIQIWASAAYVMVFPLGVHWFGLIGPGLAACTLMLVSLAGMIRVLRQGRVAAVSAVSGSDS